MHSLALSAHSTSNKMFNNTSGRWSEWAGSPSGKLDNNDGISHQVESIVALLGINFHFVTIFP